MGKRRHPSACKSSPMRYLAAEEADLSDGVQHGSLRREGYEDNVYNQQTGMQGLKNKFDFSALTNYSHKERKFAKHYNKGFQEANIDAMDDLDDMSFERA